jgi:sugar phosphate isomerase/epimerase
MRYDNRVAAGWAIWKAMITVAADLDTEPLAEHSGGPPGAESGIRPTAAMISGTRPVIS